MLSMQPRSPRTTAPAPVASITAHLCSAIAAEMSPNLTANVPPKPQHFSHSSISFSATPGMRRGARAAGA